MNFQAFALCDMKWRYRKTVSKGKRLLYLNVFAFGTVLAFEEVLCSVYMIPRVITYRFNSKTQQQLFLSLYGCHIGVPPRDTNMASPYKALTINLVETFLQITHV